MSSKASDYQEKYISVYKAQSILNTSFERITWFIATERLSSKLDPQDRSRKLVSLQDTYELRDTSPQLLEPWLIYALVDPRDNAIRYVGRLGKSITYQELGIRTLGNRRIKGIHEGQYAFGQYT